MARSRCLRRTVMDPADQVSRTTPAGRIVGRMIVEYIRYTIPEDGPRCVRRRLRTCGRVPWPPRRIVSKYELSACDEDPSQYVLRIEWDSSEGHLGGFRRSEHFRAFLPHIQPYIKAIAEMRHYTPTRVAGAGGAHLGRLTSRLPARVAADPEPE